MCEPYRLFGNWLFWLPLALDLAYSYAVDIRQRVIHRQNRILCTTFARNRLQTTKWSTYSHYFLVVDATMEHRTNSINAIKDVNMTAISQLRLLILRLDEFGHQS